MEVEFRVEKVLFYPQSGSASVTLNALSGDKTMVIYVGVFEAISIQMGLEKVETNRPLTYDLMRNMISQLDVKVEKVVVSNMRENTFIAEIHMKRGQEEIIADARPSDAIALALRVPCPIYIEDAVLDKVEADRVGEEAAALIKEFEALDPKKLPEE